MSEPLQQFGPEIWIADGPVTSFYGFPYPTRMVVIRLSDGGLFVWSPVALSDSLRVAIDVLGPVRHLVSPNALHHLFLGEWKSGYPAARLYASPRLRRKRKDLTFDAELGDAPEPEWAADIDQVVVHGSFALTEVVFFHHSSHTALFADLIQNLPRDWFARRSPTLHQERTVQMQWDRVFHYPTDATSAVGASPPSYRPTWR
jgi:hypothetical protein